MRHGGDNRIYKKALHSLIKAGESCFGTVWKGYQNDPALLK